MVTVPIYNQAGAAEGNYELSDAIFGIAPKKSVIHQVYRALEANARQPWADTKDRGEVRGGGRKPWKQKGTGRARHGSTRSPIWAGGGVTFGPLSIRNYKQKINKKMNALAVRMCLSGKVQDGALIVVSDIVNDGKTKTMAGLRKRLPGEGKTAVFLTSANDHMLQQSIQNVPSFDIARVSDVNVRDLLHHQYVITTKEGIAALEKRFAS